MAPVIGTRKTIIKVDGDDYSAEVSRCAVTSAESKDDFISFAEALAGGKRDWHLALTLRQDTAATSLWYFAWDNAGDDVAIEFWPNGGGVTESATTPKITGTVTITEPDGDFVGGEANKSVTATNVVKVEWQFTTKPVLDITP